MKVKTYKSGHKIRTILTGMILNRRVLSRISVYWKSGGLFDSRWANLIGGWAVEHFRKHQRPPKNNISDYYGDWAEEHGRKDKERETIEKFLTTLSNDYEAGKVKISSSHILDAAKKHFEECKYRKIGKGIEQGLAIGDLDAARKALTKYGEFEGLLNESYVSLMDVNHIVEIQNKRPKSIIAYPGPLGEFLGNSLGREDFIAFLAPDKVGKSWMLIDMAWMGMKQGLNVCMFQCGDMFELQIKRRFYIRAAHRPLEAKLKVKLPTFMDTELGPNKLFVKHDVIKSFKHKITDRELKLARKRHLNHDRLRISVHSSASINMLGIRDILERWSSTDGWFPDVVVIDYADLLMPFSGYTESRDSIDANWKHMRKLSQDMHCLVVTATQTKATAYDAPLIGRGHFSEDKRKNAHVTGMLGINQVPHEKKQEVCRLNWVQLREREFQEDACVYLAGCKDIGRPILLSSF